MTIQLTTTEVRLSYAFLTNPREDQNGNLKYSVTCLLPKSDKVGYELLKSAIENEVKNESNGKLKGVNPQAVKNPIHDGDGFTQNGQEFGPECKGHWVFTATCSEDRPPIVVDQRIQPILDKTQLYSGMYGHVALSVYAYNNQSKGIGFGLNGVQKSRDGEPLGFSFNPTNAFSVIDNSGKEIDPITGMPV